MSKSILIVEDEQVLRESLAELLAGEGYAVSQAGDGRKAYEMVLEQPFDLVLTDVRMPEMDGLTLLDHLRKTAPEMPVIILTAFGTLDLAVESMKAGASDFLQKPVNFGELLVRVQRALETAEVTRSRQVITEQLAAESMFHNLVGEAKSMSRLFEVVRKLSTVKSSVLIVGESGTGKELFARAIHFNGATRDKPFVAVNCGAIPQTLIESELFGYRRGAFTGANRDKIGYFEAANHGTLFLDEISTLPLAVQSSLLRVLEEKMVVPVGDTRPRPVDVRIIAASNRDLDKMVANGEFREDLIYRLNVVKIELPPLRQRIEDIPLLVHHFIAKYTQQMNKRVLGVTGAALRAMLAHEWRGNVRELENVIERAVIFAEDRHIDVEDLPFVTPGAPGAAGGGDESLKSALEQFERQHIIHALRRHKFDKAETARQLGIGLSSLYRKLEDLHVPKSLAEPGSAPPAAPQPAAPPAASGSEPRAS